MNTLCLSHRHTHKHRNTLQKELVQSYSCVVEMIIVSHVGNDGNDGGDDDDMIFLNVDQSVVIQCN